MRPFLSRLSSAGSFRPGYQLSDASRCSDSTAGLGKCVRFGTVFFFPNRDLWPTDCGGVVGLLADLNLNLYFFHFWERR